MIKKYPVTKWTIRASILTPILIVICIFLMGGGHGWYTPSMVLFPWATLNTAWENHLSASFMIVGIFQFIVYGFLIDRTKGIKSRSIMVTGILLSHIILVVFILTLKNPEWR